MQSWWALYYAVGKTTTMGRRNWLLVSLHSPGAMADTSTMLFAETFLARSSSWWTYNLRTGITRRTGPPTPPCLKSRRVQLAMTSMSTCLARSTRVSASLLLIMSQWLLCLMCGLHLSQFAPAPYISGVPAAIYKHMQNNHEIIVHCLQSNQVSYAGKIILLEFWPICILTILPNYIVSMLPSQQEILSLVRVPIRICWN